MAEPFLTLERQGRIARLVLDHPPVNALGRQLLDELDQAVDYLQNDPKAKVAVILSGIPNVFIAHLPPPA